jgi:hypothetical protein
VRKALDRLNQDRRQLPMNKRIKITLFSTKLHTKEDGYKEVKKVEAHHFTNNVDIHFLECW